MFFTQSSKKFQALCSEVFDSFFYLSRNFYLEQEKERKSQEQADTKLAKALKQKRSLSAGSILDSGNAV